MAESLTTVQMSPVQLAQWQQMQAGGEVRMDPAKAAAFDTWTGQGGGVRKRGVRKGSHREEYRSGPMKGMTREETMQRFERMWESSSPEVKAKYQRRATDSPAPVGGNAANGARPGESMPDYYKRIGMAPKATAAKTTAQKPNQPALANNPQEQAQIDKSIRTPVKVAPIPKAPVGQTAGLTTAGGDQSQAATPTFEELTNPNTSKFSTDGMRHSIGDGAPSVPVERSGGFTPAHSEEQKRKAAEEAAKPPSTNHRGGQAITNPPSAPVTGNFRGGQPVTTATKPAPTGSRYPVGRGRVGGSSASAQQGRISTGGSPSAPPAVRDQAADVADRPWQNVAGQPPQVPVPRPMPDQKPSAPATTVRPAPRIGATPAGMELVGMKSGVPQYAPVGEVYGQAPSAADSAPAGGRGPVRQEVTAEQIRGDYQTRMQTPQMRAGADNAMRASGLVVRTPVQPPPVQQPAGRPDGYKAPSMQDDWKRERETAAARQAGTMGDYFTGQGKPEMAKAFPNRTANPAGLTVKPAGAPLQSPFGSIRKPATSIRPAFRR